MEKINKIKKETFIFVVVGFLALIGVVVSVMLFYAFSVAAKSEDAITQVGSLYMSGISKEISMHFETTINLRLNQLENINKRNIQEGFLEDKDLNKHFISEGQICEFDCLALFSREGDIEMIYGDEFALVDPAPFINSLNNGEKKVAIGKNSKGEDVIILGSSAEYPMENGKTCTALLAGISVDYIDYILSLDLESSSTLTFSHIIRRDGSFIIRSLDTPDDNFFDHVTNTYREYNGKTPQQYIDDFKAAIEDNEEYFTTFSYNGEIRSLYCTKLPNSEWYLVTVMPYSDIGKVLNHLESNRVLNLSVSIGIIFLFVVILFIAYYRLTQRQIKEVEVARSEAIRANKAKSEFLSNMSHDIRTPMNGIVGMTAIAIANIDNIAQVRTCLRKISLSSKHLLGLINDILDMSKIESGKMTLNIDNISLREIMSDFVNIVQPQIKSRRQKFDVRIYDIQTENVYCDSLRLNQVVLNILSNAIKFTPDEGTIQVALYQEDSEKGDNFVKVHINVKDTGIGMSPEFKEKIFDSFAREDSKRVQKTEGTGLGMAITKYIIDAMKGTIEVDSEQGKGTEFRIAVDLERATALQEDMMMLPKWDMLVVDDDKEVCDGVVKSLGEIGVNVESAMDGETALKMIAERHNRHKNYQIILLDWKLPEIDGIETARRIHKIIEDDSIPIILISAYDCSEIEEEAREAGVTGFISKPLFKSTLYYGLRQYAEGYSEEDAVQENDKNNLKGVRVLVAEDNELNWEVAYELLTAELGLEMELAENGQICVDKFKSSEIGYYQAILMDVRMPVMNGLEATEIIRKLDRADSQLPIIAMTADAFSEDIKKCIESGMNAHMAKPIDVGEVWKLLSKYVKGDSEN